MPINLNKHATTASKAPDAMQVHCAAEDNLQPRFGMTEQTIDQLPRQDALADRSPMAKQLHTMLMLLKKAMALHKSVLISCYYPLGRLCECLNTNYSSVGLDCHSWRHRVGHRRDLDIKALRSKRSCFRITESEDVHVVLKIRNQRVDGFEWNAPNLGIEHVAVWITARLSKTKKTVYALRFQVHIDRADLERIRTVPLVNRKKFDGRLVGLLKRRAPSGQSLCRPWSVPELKHDLKPSKSLQNNVLFAKLSGCEDQALQSRQLRLETTSERCFTTS